MVSVHWVVVSTFFTVVDVINVVAAVSFVSCALPNVVRFCCLSGSSVGDIEISS